MPFLFQVVIINHPIALVLLIVRLYIFPLIFYGSGICYLGRADVTSGVIAMEDP